MTAILSFLRELEQHNDREWFAAHKMLYQQAQEQWNAFCQELIQKVGAFDPDIARLTLRDCTYRIYRDTRFSHDKSPYKTHFGVFLCPGGKRSMHAGYYFHVGTGTSDTYPHAHMLASGNYCYDPAVVKILREDIHYGWDEFASSVLSQVAPGFALDMEGALKRVPAGFPADGPDADWLRLKAYGMSLAIDDDFVLAPHLADRVADLFRTVKPLNDFINRAVDYVRQEK